VYHFSQDDGPELDKKDEEEDDCWYSGGDLPSRDKTNDLPAEDPMKEAIKRRAAKNESLDQL
jgi:hypothetical protein